MFQRLLQPPFPKIFTITGLSMIIFSLVVLFAPWRDFLPSDSFLSPIADYLPVFNPPAKNRPIVFGFLPFWNFKYEPNFRYNLLTHLAFFGLDFDSQGNIRTHLPDSTQEPGWTAYQSEAFGRIVRRARQSGTKVIVVLRAMDQATIESII